MDEVCVVKVNGSVMLLIDGMWLMMQGKGGTRQMGGRE